MSKRNKSIYIVVKGRQPGVYTQWEGPQGARAQVEGYPGAIFKGFYTTEEAYNWLNAQPHHILAPTLKEWSAKQGTAGTNDTLDSLLENHLSKGGIVIFTDGSALGNPGPGGYGAVVLKNQSRQEISGGFRYTTNNRMELTACIAALESLHPPAEVLLITDSAYVCRAITEGWLQRWTNNFWRRHDGKPVENVDLWQRLDHLCRRFQVQFYWIKGHNATVENEVCDRLARSAALQPDLPEDAGFQVRYLTD
ncbi:MAG: ribonuclease HI [Anaerolineae bacterium]|jgi:ribonuclease HI|nr:MAG: ribonuclease HI [Anaerolineae bacterium]